MGTHHSAWHISQEKYFQVEEKPCLYSFWFPSLNFPPQRKTIPWIWCFTLSYTFLLQIYVIIENMIQFRAFNFITWIIIILCESSYNLYFLLNIVYSMYTCWFIRHFFIHLTYYILHCINILIYCSLYEI